MSGLREIWQRRRAGGVKRCEFADVFKAGSDPGAAPSVDDVAAIDAYLRHFIPPGAFKCVGCGATLGGLLGSFIYDLRHGEGRCAACGWPARANHYDFRPVKSLSCVLQYHPDELTFDEAEEVPA